MNKIQKPRRGDRVWRHVSAPESVAPLGLGIFMGIAIRGLTAPARVVRALRAQECLPARWLLRIARPGPDALASLVQLRLSPGGPSYLRECELEDDAGFNAAQRAAIALAGAVRHR